MPHRVMSCVKEFYEKFDQPSQDRPIFVKLERRKFRMKLLEDAYHDYRYAERGNDLTKVSVALADMLYAIGGTALEYGLPLDKIFLEVHKSNLTRLDANGDPVIREDGKIMKGEQYRRPDIVRILCDAMYPPEDED
jgi:predicted HAD superfamily Cof-like phosphohydrolase